jgi:hypothetical protein
MNRDLSFGIATGYGLNGRCSIPGRGKKLCSTASRLAMGPTQPPIEWVEGALSPGVKRQGDEADNSPITIVEVKNGRTTPLFTHTS